MPFTFTATALPGVTIIEPAVFADSRGFFMETYKRSAFAEAGLDMVFVQENHSRSVRGTLRGLHLQRPPRAQGKLVRVLQGEILDVAADIRPDSPTFGKWESVTLSETNRRSLYIPAGVCTWLLRRQWRSGGGLQDDRRVRPGTRVGRSMGRSAAVDSVADFFAYPVGARQQVASADEMTCG